jgi:hypothetical protein
MENLRRLLRCFGYIREQGYGTRASRDASFVNLHTVRPFHGASRWLARLRLSRAVA